MEPKVGTKVSTRRRSVDWRSAEGRAAVNGLWAVSKKNFPGQWRAAAGAARAHGRIKGAREESVDVHGPAVRRGEPRESERGVVQ